MLIFYQCSPTAAVSLREHLKAVAKQEHAGMCMTHPGFTKTQYFFFYNCPSDNLYEGYSSFTLKSLTFQPFLF